MFYKIVIKTFFIIICSSAFILSGCSNVRLQSTEESKANVFKFTSRHASTECYKLISTFDKNDCLDQMQEVSYEEYLELHGTLD